MDINALNLTPVERSRCLHKRLCFVCKKANCSTRNHPRADTTARLELRPTRPARNPKRIQATSTTEEGDLLKYVRELEGKGNKPNELLHLLQLVVDTDEQEEVSFWNRKMSQRPLPLMLSLLY